MASAIGDQWRKEFITVLQQRENATSLKEAALHQRLGAWTKALTSVVIVTCDAIGWHASAKGHPLDAFPVSRGEYLALDVIAFEKGEKKWHFPVAIMELENNQRDDLIAYALWKLLCVRAQLRILFCYRPSADQAPTLVRFLRDQVVSGMNLDERSRLEGDTLVVVGNREESAIFPYGFFKWWQLETNTGTFRLI